MEATFYEDQSFLLSNKNSYVQDNGKLCLNLASDCKNPGRREEFDISDLLGSPDIGISSPDLETIVWRNFPETCSIKLQSPSPPPLFVSAQEDYSTQQVTAEQEVFARGFTDALQRLREEREVILQRKSETPTSEESTRVVDDSKCTFVSYRFDSLYRLPSFQDTFLPAKFTGTVKIKADQENDTFTYCERERNGQEFEGSEISEWFKVETLEEGFSGQQEMCSLKGSLLNQSGEEDSDESSTNSPWLQSPASEDMMQEYSFEDFENERKAAEDVELHHGVYKQGDFEQDVDWIQERDSPIKETPAPKHWLTVHTKLYNMSVLKQEVDTLEEHSQTAAIPGDDIDVQGFIKIERKRRKNRLAAWKCRQKKLIRETRLETKVEELYVENSRLMEELEKLKRKRQQLEQTFIKHVTSGCEEAHVQYTESFTGEI